MAVWWDRPGGGEGGKGRESEEDLEGLGESIIGIP